MKTARFASLDLEFTGFDPAKDEIIEVGILTFDITPDGKLEKAKHGAKHFSPWGNLDCV